MTKKSSTKDIPSFLLAFTHLRLILMNLVTCLLPDDESLCIMYCTFILCTQTVITNLYQEQVISCLALI